MSGSAVHPDDRGRNPRRVGLERRHGPPSPSNSRRSRFDTGQAQNVTGHNGDRVLAAAQTTEGRAAKKDWDETLRNPMPNPGWTARLGDIGRPLGISAVAVGKILHVIGVPFRREGHR